jgi:ADP-heptose:LPS heptosyltransferase
MIRLINGSDFFIGIDSGPSHIATAFGKKSILFFGAVNPWFRHFRSLFNGIIMQSYCEFANCYHTSNNGKETVCRLVGNEGMPKCSIHQTQDILNNIIKLTSSDKKNL